MYKDYKGSIALHRKIRKSWIWDPKKPQYYLWWSDILMDANWQNVEVPTENGIDVYMRGHVYRPITEYAEYWGVNRRTVSNFFRKLENSDMIRRSSNVTGTVIEIVNYDDYQSLPKNAKHTQRETVDTTGVDKVFKVVTAQHTAQPTAQHTAQPTAQHTAHKRITNNNLTNNYINNLENNNNEKPPLAVSEKSSFEKDYSEIINHMENTNFGVISQNVFEDLEYWLKEFDKDMLKKAASIADEKGKANYAYMKGILKSWKTKKLKSLSDVEADQKKFQSQKSISNSKDPQYDAYVQQEIENRKRILEEQKKEDEERYKDLDTSNLPF